MKIDRAKYEEAYKLGRKVYANELRLTDAKNSLKAIGLNSSSAVDLVANLRRLLDGQRYTRALSTATTDHYLTWILRDYGEPALKRAVSALEQHIQYYQSLKGDPMRTFVQVLEKHRKLLEQGTNDFSLPEEISPTKKILEGRIKTVAVNYYERSAKARNACIAAHGTICEVCRFDFGEIYGVIGKGFIHVHHLRDVASIGKEYEINPIEDLRPVCPNCHAMLHKSNPSYSLKELKEIIEAQKK